MNKRTVEMIGLLSDRREAQTLQSLAQHFDVSQRTVRNDLKEIGDLLSENNLSPLKIARGGVIETADDFSKLQKAVSPTDYYTYRLSREERKMVAAALLINSAGYITLAEIADNLFVSRATIISDLDDIKKFIRDGGLEVTSHPNKGLLVEGKESVKRRFLYQLSAFHLQKPGQGANNSSPMISVQAGDEITIQKILNEQSKIHRTYLSDSSFLKIQKYLGIMISRNMEGEYIEPQGHADSPHDLFAQDILRYIAQYCGIHTNEDEAAYLSILLDQCRYVHKQDFDTDDVRIQLVTRQFIRNISEELQVNLDNDYIFFENLSNHLQSMYAADAAQFPDNPELREIVEDHPDVAGAVLDNLPVLQRYNSREITDVEQMYIVVHVCAAIERKKNSEISFHVIVACHAGIGTSQLLMEKLKKHFNFQIVDVISAHEATMLDANAADFVISTIPLQSCPIDYVVVSPLLSDEDYLRVGNKIDSLRNSRNLPSRIEEKDVTAKGVLDRIRPILETQVPDQADALMRQIRRTVRKYFQETLESEQEIIAPYLHQLLPPDNIQVDVECTDWRDAIRKSAQPLEQKGYIEHRYIDAMIRNVEENGPYIVISKGFAAPHEGLDMGSIRTGMNLIRLKTPVNFGEEELDPVEFVCTISAVDHKTHLKAFFNLVNMLQNEEFHQELHDAKTPGEISRIIEKYEYTVSEN